jgi:hypothetical protein
MKNRFLKTALLLLSLACIFSEKVTAQESGYGAFVHETFQNHMNNLHNESNSKAFLAAFDSSLIWVDVRVAIDGRVAMRGLGKEYLQKLIYRVNANRSLRITWDIVKFNELTSRENTYMGSFEVDVNIFLNDTLISSGKNFIEILSKKRGENFLIQYFSVVQIANQTNIGRCFLKTEKVDQVYRTNLSFPNGTEYESVENQIQFIGSEKLVPVKLNPGDQTYYWNTIEKIVSKEQSGNIRLGENTIGSEAEVIKVILQQNHGNKCTHIIPVK